MTKWVGLAILAALLSLDVYLDMTDKTTISRYILDITENHSHGWLMPLIFGVFMGHFFWPQRSKR